MSSRAIDSSTFQVATARTARVINRRVVLNLIRKHQPISRADLSRRSRLQRSTVSSITKQLIAERWVTFGMSGDAPLGRKPTFLHLNDNCVGIIGIDIRPTETAIVLADLHLRFLYQASTPTGKDPREFVARLCERLVQLIGSHPRVAVEGIGVALPGRVDGPSHRIVFAPNLGWETVDLNRPLEEATGLPVELENAANACALGEVWSGSHPENIRNLVALTVSEGIGVGIILNGQLFRGATGSAGEFGHVTVEEDGPLCQCGNRGCFEACASNLAAVRYFNELTSRQSGDEPLPEPTFDLVVNLAEQGNGHACSALDRMARALGAGLAVVVNGLVPDVVVVVGEVTRAWRRVGPILNRVMRERLPAHLKTCIVPGAPDAYPRLRGAAALVLQKHFGALTTL